MPRLASPVFLLKLFPGIPPAVARAILPGVRGLVVQGFGAGNFPIEGEGSLLPLFDEARDRGITTVMVSQAHFNSVDLSLYEAGAAALKRGVISGGDMTPEAAVVKLMHVLAYQEDRAKIRAQLQADLVGERTVS
jgi:L-asparaginase